MSHSGWGCTPMSELHSFLKFLKSEGEMSTPGEFTIDFSKAREKLAKFRLTDPHEVFLKFVQAANLAARSIEIEFEDEVRVTFTGWDSAYTLKALAQRMLTAQLSREQNVLDHLSVGLSTLLTVADSGVVLRQSEKGSNAITRLALGGMLECHEESTAKPNTNSVLIISWKNNKTFKPNKVNELLDERCRFTRVPITFDGALVLAALPETSGRYRVNYFTDNRALATSFYRAKQDRYPQLIESLGGKKSAERGPHTALLQLSVDLDPKATIFLALNGVIVEKRRLDLRAPGVVGIVSADGLPTDLTGAQLVESEELTELLKWVQNAATPLLNKARTKVKGLRADVAPRDALSGCSAKFSMLGLSILYLLYFVALIGGVVDQFQTYDASTMMELLSWLGKILSLTVLAVFLISVWKKIYKLFSENSRPNRKTHQEARNHVHEQLSKYG